MSESQPVGYALQVRVNPGRPGAYWQMDEEVELRDTPEEAWADMEQAMSVGYVPSDLRVVALTVLTTPPGRPSERRP